MTRRSATATSRAASTRSSRWPPALQDRLVTPNSQFVIPPSINVAGTPFHDAETHGTEHLTLTGILAKSSNIGAIKVARAARRRSGSTTTCGRSASASRPGSACPGRRAGILPPLPTLVRDDVADAVVRAGRRGHRAADRQRLLDDREQRRAGHAEHRRGHGRLAGHHVHAGAAPPAQRRVISAQDRDRAARHDGVGRRATRAPRRRRGSPATGSPARPVRRPGRTATAATPARATPRRSSAWCRPTTRSWSAGSCSTGRCTATSVVRSRRPVFHKVMSFALQTDGRSPRPSPQPPKATLTW